MDTSDDQGGPSATELREKFGPEADTYAAVRADAAAEAGREDAAGKWGQLASQLQDEDTIGGTFGGAVIESSDDLMRHLRHERKIYARTLEMYRIGKMRVVSNAVDMTTYQMTDLQDIINNIDQLLERMDNA